MAHNAMRGGVVAAMNIASEIMGKPANWEHHNEIMCVIDKRLRQSPLHESNISSYDQSRRACQECCAGRSGCFCNPGVREICLDFAGDELLVCFLDKEQTRYSQFLEKIDDRAKEGALRISVGLVTNFADVSCCLQFVQSFVDRWASQSA
jgi:hypothetical protein